MAYVAEVIVHHHPSPRRDPAQRRRHVLRNTLWCAWLRRPWPTALRQTARLVARGPFDVIWAHALLAGASGIPWVLRKRRVVPPGVESARQRLERADRERTMVPALLRRVSARVRREG